MQNEDIIENIVKYKLIKDGYTNISYHIKTKDNNYFYQQFVSDKFNHGIDYNLLTDFNFVPKILSHSNKELFAVYLKPEKIILNDSSLSEIAKIIYTTNNSEKQFPKCNIKGRIKQYYKIVKAKPNIPNEINEYKKFVLKLLKNLPKNTPSHNDPWINNFFKHDKKYYLSDWEYATMNNANFDIAYFITGSYLNKYQEDKFLNFYGEYNKDELLICKIIILYISILWIFKQDQIPYPYKPLLKDLNNYIKQFKQI